MLWEKEKKKDRTFERGGICHKDYARNPKVGRFRGHDTNNSHGDYPHMNIKRKYRKNDIVNIIGKQDMSKYLNLHRWIDSGKQIGKTFSFSENGVLHWSSVAIQKWKDVIKVHIDEIPEAQMSEEIYTKDEIVEFKKITDAIEYIIANAKVKPEDLKPCKGQKIFNPK